MEIELREIRDFIARHPPFDALPADTVDTLPRKLRVRYQRRGDRFPPAAQSAALYIVRSGAIELRDPQGQLIDKLGEGDFYNATCTHNDNQTELTAICSEDSLLYLLPCDELSRLLQTSTLFTEHFNDSLRERLRSAVDRLQEDSTRSAALTTVVGDLVTRNPVTVKSGNSIRASAKIMADEQVSSVMILDDDDRLEGLITDSDLRKRCLATGVSPERPIDDIMTRNIESIPDTAPAYDALLKMTELKLHHLPVMKAGRLHGMISVSDLIRLQSHNPAHITVAVRKAQTPEDLQRLGANLPELQAQLVRTGVSAGHLSAAITSISDGITTRLLELAQQTLGPAPVPYTWLAGGSQGRREQTCHTDQDNALLIANNMKDSDRAYFTELSRFVCDGLNACGFVYCPGDAMASNESWRQPCDVWRGYFNDWIGKPEPKALMLASIFFDLRPVYGDKSLYEALQQDVLAQCKDNAIFIAHLVSNALTHRPPLGFFRNLVLIHDQEHKDTLDIKHRGIVPVVDIARVYALQLGIPAVNTLERLQQACESGALSADMHASLRDAFELMSSLRIRHQARQIAEGLESDNYISPKNLSSLERHHLKDAFSIVKSLQETLANRYQAGRFA